ncbi:hypothetical protein OG874_40660 [Nocardia sp. NBC_00565]|uniref:hypothetical protein n=1 Tax=Nocardia sp. NBC_00565 TaxID=2975993 RepID=UPI002E7FD2D5|nr:hypothetical protein [Nocardia sp. NBC_00565]WUC02939.1 hypothetical protein OG874_40660 [Nocardia sp. NBC_00565]
MSDSSMLGVKTGDLGRFANDLGSSGQVVRNRAKDVGDNLFGPADAGENYRDRGKKIQDGLEKIYTWLGNWSEATLATSDVVGASVVKYSNTDDENSHDIAKLGK